MDVFFYEGKVVEIFIVPKTEWILEIERKQVHVVVQNELLHASMHFLRL